MDINNFKTSDWLKVGGALGVLVFGLTSWASAAGVSGGNAFDFTLTGAIPWLLIVASGVVAALLAGGVIKKGTTPWDVILLATFGIGALLILIRLVIGPKIEVAGETFELNRGFGLWLSTIAAIVAAVGAVLAFKEAGGTMADLTDRNRLRSQFNRPGDDGGPGEMPPPPPPGSSAPPPPPAPPAP